MNKDLYDDEDGEFYMEDIEDDNRYINYDYDHLQAMFA
jgi:hypothetical protein